jgi:TolB-like protein
VGATSAAFGDGGIHTQWRKIIAKLFMMSSPNQSDGLTSGRDEDTALGSVEPCGRLSFPIRRAYDLSKRKPKACGRSSVLLAFGDHRLDIERRELRRGAQRIELEPKVFDLLAFLVRNRGRVVSKDDLLDAVWDGRIVSESALTTRINAARRALGDDGASQRLIRTFNRKGVRFIGEVTETSDEAPHPHEAPGPMLPPDKPSLAVLPFQNMTGDPEQEYFVDGMAEEITMAIARLPWLFVIARNSAFTYKGRQVDVKQVARELGVSYVLEGSVRKAGNRVRITGQLIDTTTGVHIWVDRFDGVLDDIFELQEQVASNVAGAIEPKLRRSEIEHASRKPAANLTAYDLYLRSLAQSYRFTEEDFAEAVALARQALAIDPSYTPAAALVGRCLVHQRVQGWGALSAADVAEACRLARQALEAERDDTETIGQAAYTLFSLAGEAALAAAALDRALALNPNAAHAWYYRGIIHAQRNEPEPAIEAIERARRLSPFDPYTFRFANTIAIVHLAAGRFEQAIEWADRASHDQPRMIAAMRVKVVANAHLGRFEQARAELSRVLAIDPKLTIAGYRAYAHFMAPELIELYITGLRLADLPEK